MGKLTLLHINIIGVVVGIIVALGIWFTLITGAQDAQQQAQKAHQDVMDRANKATTAANALKKAQADKVAAERDYGAFQVAYMPTIGYSRFTGPEARVRMMKELFWPNGGKSWPERYRRIIAGYMAAEQKRNGIVWVNPMVTAMGPFGPDPNTIDAAQPGEKLGPVLHYRYEMQVTGKNLASLINHEKGWPRIREAGVPVVENVQIAGNSPNLTMSYRLTFTIILKDVDAKAIPPEDPRVTGSNNSSGGGGGGGFGSAMGMPGMMGRPGMMSGGMGPSAAGAPISGMSGGGMSGGGGSKMGAMMGAQ